VPSDEEVKRALADARERLAAMEVELRALTQIVEGSKFVAEQSIRLGERFDAFKDDLKDLRDDLAGVAQGCKDVVTRMDKFAEARSSSRVTIIVGLIGFAGIIAAAVLPKVL
jgi:hypothetical protein